MPDQKQIYLFWLVAISLVVLSNGLDVYAIDIEPVKQTEQVEAYFEHAREIELDKGYGYQKILNKEVIRPLTKIADDYYRQKRYKEAEDIYLRVLGIFERSIGDDNSEYRSLKNRLSRIYQDTNQPSKMAKVLADSGGLEAGQSERNGKSDIREMRSLAYEYKKMGALSKAITQYEKLLKIYLEENAGQYNNGTLANELYNLALLYSELGDYASAEPYYRRSLLLSAHLPESEEITDITGIPLVKLQGYGNILMFIGKYEQAEKLFGLMLEQANRSPAANKDQIASILYLRGDLYNQLGSYDNALRDKKQSVAIFTELYGPEHHITAYAMNMLAETYISLKAFEQALPLMEKVVAIQASFKRQPGELYVDTNYAKSNLARVYLNVGRKMEAERIYRQVLEETVKNYPVYHPLISYTKINLAESLFELKKYNEATDQARNALIIADDKGSPHLAIQSFMLLAKICATQNRLPEAIFYAKQAVNKVQTLRSGLVDTDKALQDSFASSNQEVYQLLAGWLIGMGRMSEAEQVMAMLKEQEYFNYIMRAAAIDPRITQSQLNKIEAEQQKYLQQASQQQAIISRKLGELESIKAEYRTPEQNESLSRLINELSGAQAKYRAVLLNIEMVLKQAGAGNALSVNIDQSDNDIVSSDIAENNEVALVYFLPQTSSIQIVVRTSGKYQVKQTRVSEKEFTNLVWELKEKIKRPDKNFLPASQKMYKWLIQPIEKELQELHIKHLIVYKYGVLRYIPFATLHDGKKYLVENYAISNYSIVTVKRGQSPSDWFIAGMGVSKPIKPFAPLPMVPLELNSIIKTDKQDVDGIFNGQVYIDDAFTLERFKDSLKGDFNVGHIATHYEFRSGTEADSFLLLGDGSRLDLASIRRANLNFSNIDLLTLSACETAVSEKTADGREIEGLAILVQRQGARSVLASLWKVADCSTGVFMQSFYRYRKHGENKAQALRHSQLDFIKGQARLTACAGRTGNETYIHPYFWAPFVLMGNWY